ncbi:HesA/MoeB/ThiF family protein [Thalassotalea litorea]|uniref:HesA/MoeB/ThiF family protein n=1 Tax=Thalassotalea litorea TaxID=2020715 RepID=A0A5R9IWV8_9GAMM|nr:HesA/MoeB/ThiF family protein [Thalassotalea litorea]TLU66408.1 HesA/MoeB/ThiF family protein [Thalassotalea litorea]
MLTTQEQLRYSRQTLVSGFGESGQIALQNACVLVVGIGGLGNPVSQYLVSAGIGKIILCDGDSIDVSNLPRQILFDDSVLADNKAETAANRLEQSNPECNIEVVDEMLDDELADYYISQADIVIDCTDNVASRYTLNAWCLKHQTPLVIGAATGLDGQHFFIDPKQQDSACYQCLFPETQQAPVQNCQTIGIIGPVLAIVGGMQSLTAIKYLVGMKTFNNRLELFDGAYQSWQSFTVQKQPNCPACANTQ